MVLTRLLIVAGIALTLLLGLRLYQQAVFSRRIREGLKLPAYHPGRPAILYFTAQGCSPCETIQKPALREIGRRYTDQIQILTYDAGIDIGLAQAWGVLSVPTTFLIDSLGRPRRVNHGPVDQHVLIAQLKQLGELHDSDDSSDAAHAPKPAQPIEVESRRGEVKA